MSNTEKRYTGKQLKKAGERCAKNLGIKVTTLGLRLGGTGEFFNQLENGRTMRIDKYDHVVNYLKENGGFVAPRAKGKTHAV